MNHSLKDFESWVSKSVLYKGENYWDNDNVQNLEQEGTTWAADVYGTDDYLTEITLIGGQVTEWSCDCPYDYGSMCKHVVAVLFAVRDAAPDELLDATATEIQSLNALNKKQQKSKPSTPIEEIIEKLDEVDVRRLLTFFAKRNNEVHAHLLSKYAHLLEVVSKKQYEDLIKSHIDSHSSGNGYLEYYNASNLGDDIYELIEAVDESNPMGVVYLCEAAIEQLSKIYENADDSSGSLGGAIEAAFDRLIRLTYGDGEVSDEALEYIFNYAIETSAKRSYRDWNWDSEIRSLAFEAVTNKEQANQLMQVLNQTIQKYKDIEYSTYATERIETLKLKLLNNYYSPEIAQKFLNNNLHYASFRKMALENAMQEKQYETVRQLAKEGIIQDTGNYRGSVIEWKKWLIRLAEATGNTTDFIKLNEELFFDRGNMEYYRALKKVIPPDTFKTKIESYIQHFRAKENPNWRPSLNTSIASILKEENRLEDLMHELKKTSSLYVLDEYFDLLSNNFKTDYIHLYKKLILQYMEQNTGRKYYVECCKYIDKIISLGGENVAKVIVKGWQKRYPRRRAMVEELARYKW